MKTTGRSIFAVSHDMQNMGETLTEFR